MSECTGAPLLARGRELRVFFIAAFYMLSGLAVLAWDARVTNQTPKRLLKSVSPIDLSALPLPAADGSSPPDNGMYSAGFLTRS